MCRNKYLLLNSQELNELSAISMKANIPEVEALVNTDRSLVCDGKKGLLTRILTVMKREPPDSSFRSELRESVSDRVSREGGNRYVPLNNLFYADSNGCESIHCESMLHKSHRSPNGRPADDMVPHLLGFPIIIVRNLAGIFNIGTLDTFFFSSTLKC